jgi:hypothetical protein
MWDLEAATLLHTFEGSAASLVCKEVHVCVYVCVFVCG